MSCYAPLKVKQVQKEQVKVFDERVQRLKRAECIEGLIERILGGVETEQTSMHKVQEGLKTKSKEQLEMEVLIVMFKTLITSQKEKPETATLSKEQEEQEEELLKLAQELHALRLRRFRRSIQQNRA